MQPLTEMKCGKTMNFCHWSVFIKNEKQNLKRKEINKCIAITVKLKEAENNPSTA